MIRDCTAEVKFKKGETCRLTVYYKNVQWMWFWSIVGGSELIH